MSQPELDEDLSVRNVLVPTDFSAQSYQALLYALAIVKYYASSVTLLHVIQAHGEGALQKAWRDIRKLETGSYRGRSSERDLSPSSGRARGNLGCGFRGPVKRENRSDRNGNPRANRTGDIVTGIVR